MENAVEVDQKPNWILAVLVALFASTSWLSLSSFWVEQGIHTQILPEGWQLGATLTIIIQISALLGLAYTIIENCTNIKPKTAPIILVSLIVLCLTIIPIGFYNEVTVEIAGKQRSIVLYTGMFFAGGLAILSDMLFIPYMKNLPEIYFQAYFFGVGLSNLVPSILSVIQDASTYDCVPAPKSLELVPKFSHLRYSVSTFYTIIFLWCCLGTAAFLLIHFGRKRIDKLWYGSSVHSVSTDENIIVVTKKLRSKYNEDALLNDKKDYIVMILLGLVSGQINVFLPSLQSFVVLPYSSKTYFWSLAIGSALSPFSAVVAHIFPILKLKLLTLFTVITTVASAICLIIALHSPYPWLHETKIGSVLIILLTMTVYFVGHYCRNMLFEVIRRTSTNEDLKHRRLVFGGFAGQVGCLLATIIIFPTINIFELFKSVPPC
ncbi:unnamed protein product [Bursaphelenchus okinawaensis]|uniref:Riboflavin transporter n=1 Tax=Bursaphelenchus okinawaensis TaxID=465554 RepID=A0A811KY15_9BILA|nr:unnamed protein product [Bursaphelenchus okinawaensis]CAG9114085.1 unnamed protein product [Bursaphelenchus okinawaensis]